MLDAILLEQAGIPAAAVLTEPFRRSGEAMAAHHGCPGMAYVVISHPIATQSAETLRQWAAEAAPAVSELLVSQPAGAGR